MAIRFKSKSDKAVAASYASTLKDYYYQHISPDKINPTLEQLFNSKKRYFTWPEYQTLFNGIIDDLHKPDFTFDILELSTIGNHGALGLAVLCGFNLKQALSIVLKFYRIRSQLFKLTMHEQDDKVVLEFDVNYPLNRVMQSSLELAMGTIHKSKKEILSLDDSEDAIYFSFPEPEYAERYQQFFDCPVYFNQPHNRFVFPKSQLKQKLRFANQEARETLLDQCESDLSSINVENDLVSHVKNYLQQCEEFPSLEKMADILHLSSRSLRRHLQQSNANYQSLLIDERVRRGKILLQDSDLSVTDIALKLGYAEAANFSKAFKKVTSSSPAQYRKQVQEEK